MLQYNYHQCFLFEPKIESVLSPFILLAQNPLLFPTFSSFILLPIPEAHKERIGLFLRF